VPIKHLSPRVILGLVGPSGSGKSTVGKYLTQKHGFVSFHVAATLKGAFCALFDCRPIFCEQPLIDQPADFLGGVTPRVVLEGLGTHTHDLAPGAMPLVAEARANRLLRFQPRLMIDGLRRTTEGDMVHRLGGRVLRMVGQSIDAAKPCDVSQIDVAEDFKLTWSPTLDGLYAQIDDVLRQIPGAVDGR
jgi:hypothetical protein